MLIMGPEDENGPLFWGEVRRRHHHQNSGIAHDL